LLLVSTHLLLSGAVAAAFAGYFNHNRFAVATHVGILAEWDALALLALGALVAFLPGRRIGWARFASRFLPAATFTLQIYLYALNIVSNSFWGRNITSHLIVAFAPTVLSGKEPIPVGAPGIGLFAG
jgi:peptidoglycan/LPS O-acetylase OafA/YrhL